MLLDADWRRCIGWPLGRTLEAELTLAALRMALAKCDVGPALVHHCDRGVQYAAGEYTALLAEHGIAISMSRKASSNDNAKAEPFIKTLKYEEVYLFEYENYAEAQPRIAEFIERVYNEKRLHSFETEIVCQLNCLLLVRLDPDAPWSEGNSHLSL